NGAIPGLFATGVDDAGQALPSGNDPHYTLLAPAQPAVVVSPISGAWIGNTASRRWVWQMANGLPVNVTRTFRTTFSLAGLDPTTATTTGSWATDNTGVGIALNGHDLGLRSPGFGALTPFTIPAGTPYFVAGTNTLDFTVSDVGAIAGFLVDKLTGTAAPLAA